MDILIFFPFPITGEKKTYDQLKDGKTQNEHSFSP